MSCVYETPTTTSYKFECVSRQFCPISNVFVHIDQNKDHYITFGISKQFKNQASLVKVLGFVSKNMEYFGGELQKIGSVPWFVEVPELSSAIACIDFLSKDFNVQFSDAACMKQLLSQLRVVKYY